jgi:hypothetical protein
MAAGAPLRQSDPWDGPPPGWLFRLGARAGLLTFGGVLLVGAYHGSEFGPLVLRALLALLAVTTCGWLAERVAASDPGEPEASPAEAGQAEPPERPTGEPSGEDAGHPA